MNKLILFVTITFCHITYVHSAGIFAERTRVIFYSDSISESIQLYNENIYPVLVQTWIDNGSLSPELQKKKLPLVVVPPLLRLQSNESKGIRIFKGITSELPEDRESVFWLNYQMIPPIPPEKIHSVSSIDFSVRTRLKIFFRPSSLKKEDKNWVDKIKCTMKSFATNNLIATCTNPTPFYATMDKVSFIKTHEVFYSANFMIKPFSKQDIELIYSGENRSGKVGGLLYSVINDQGFVVNLSN